MKTRWKHLSSLVFALLVLCCHGEGGVDIDIDVGEQKVDFKIHGLQNPCELHKCPDDQNCTVVYHPGFLDVPVAHCVPHDPRPSTERVDPMTCSEIKVGSNVLNCKTLDQWKRIGRAQCALKAAEYDTPLNLTDTKVVYTCHNFDGSTNSVYLQAQFTCCPRLPDSTSLDIQGSNVQPQAQTELPTDDVTENDLYVRRHFIMLPLIVGVATILGILMVLMAVRLRRRSNRRPNLSKPFIATSFVNPSADHEDTPTYDITDEYNGRSDKCLLIINEHAQYSPEAK